MATGSVPVDLFNPGQVFACLGLMEVAEITCGHTVAGFDWSDSDSARFLLRVEGDADPVAAGLAFLARARVHALAPYASALDSSKWSVPTHELPQGSPFPIPTPSSPATLPAALALDDHEVVLDSWGDGRRRGVITTRRDNVKFWGGSGGYPGVALLRDALDAVRADVEASRLDPFSLAAPQSSSFRFDWRRDYIPIDAGFSLNEHGHIKAVGYPLVEVLAAIGLNYARPERVAKLIYRYAVAGRSDAWRSELAALLPPPFLRAALGVAPVPFPTRIFTMQLGWPGKENQSRCITNVLEEAAQ